MFCASPPPTFEFNAAAQIIHEVGDIIMAYGSMPYVGMTPKKNGGHIKSAQMTRSKCLHRSVNGFHEPYQALSSTSMGNRAVNLLESIAKVPDRQSLKRAKSSIF